MLDAIGFMRLMALDTLATCDTLQRVLAVGEAATESTIPAGTVSISAAVGTMAMFASDLLLPLWGRCQQRSITHTQDRHLGLPQSLDSILRTSCVQIDEAS